MKLLEKFSSKKPTEQKSLADMIMNKLSSGDFEDGEELDAEKPRPQLDEKVIAAYRKIGVFMKTYRSGRLPKAFKLIPMVSNWEELLYLTNPYSWSRHATYEATKIFASNMNSKMV